jgi:hypothetical protein
MSFGRLLLGFWRLPLGFGCLVPLGLAQLEPLRAKFWTHCYLPSSMSFGRVLLGFWRLPLGFCRLVPLGFWCLPLVGLLASTTGLRALAQTPTVPLGLLQALARATTVYRLASGAVYHWASGIYYHWASGGARKNFHRLPLGLL